MKERLLDLARRYDIYLILVLALALRTIFLNDAFYATLAELFRDLDVIYEMFHGSGVVLLGPSSGLGGFYFGPVFYYILAPFVYIFDFLPIGAIFSSVCFSVLGVLVFYLLIKEWFNRKIAIWGTFLLAVSLYDVQTAYYASNPNFVPFFTLVVLYSLTKIIGGDTRFRWWILAGFAVGIATQLHATALFVLPLILVAVLIFKKQTRKFIQWLTLIITAVVVYTPYLVYEFKHGFSNFRRIFELGEKNLGIPTFSSLKSIAEFWISPLFFKNSWLNLFEKNPVLFLGFSIVFILLVSLVLLAFLRKSENHFSIISKEGKFLLSLWLIITMTMMLLYQRGIIHFYFLIAWPSPIIIITAVLFSIKRFGNMFFRLFISFYLVMQIVQLFYFFQTINHPELSYSVFQGIFSQIETVAGNRSYKIISDIEQINVLNYYQKLYKTKDVKSGADLLFFIVNDGNKVNHQMKNHSLIGVFSSDYYKVHIYEK